MQQNIDVLVSEVGPRDGLQNTGQFMPTEFKKKWISAAAAAGLREIEVCSFVPPKLSPLRTGIDLAIRSIVAEGIPGEPLYGYVSQAGVTKGCVPAVARAAA
jgi:hydroxymethylglutaryl-CoA lyase